MSNFVNRETIQTYNKVINGLRQDIGRNVTIVSSPTTTDCPNCWAPGHLVYTNEGPIAIENINIGKRVMTLEGNWQVVSDVKSRPYLGEMIRIFPYGNTEGLLVTPEHNLYVWQDNSIIKKMAQEITAEDYLISPRSLKFSNNQIIKINNKNLDITPNMCRIFGWYLADGRIDNGVCFGFCSGDRTVGYLSKVLEQEFDVKPKLKEGKYPYFSVSDKWFVDFVENNFGASKIKSIPEWLYKVNQECLAALFNTLIKCDGYEESANKFVIRLNNKRLIYGIQMLLKLLNLDTGLIKQYDINTWDLTFFPKSHEYNNIIVADGYYFHKVRAIEKQNYIGVVYNLTVRKSHTYYCDNFLSANCGYDTIKKRSNGKYDPDDPYPSGAIGPNAITGPIDFNATRKLYCPVCNGKGVFETTNNRSVLCLISPLSAEEAAKTSLGKDFNLNYELSAEIKYKDYFTQSQRIIIDGVSCIVKAVIPEGIGTLTQVRILAGG